jgi:hypothetical protein
MKACRADFGVAEVKPVQLKPVLSNSILIIEVAKFNIIITSFGARLSNFSRKEHDYH